MLVPPCNVKRECRVPRLHWFERLPFHPRPLVECRRAFWRATFLKMFCVSSELFGLKSAGMRTLRVLCRETETRLLQVSFFRGLPERHILVKATTDLQEQANSRNENSENLFVILKSRCRLVYGSMLTS